MLILRKVLNSLMTSWVSYFAATLIPYALSSAEASLCCREVAGRKKKKAHGARVLLDLTWPAFCRTSWQRFVFRSPILPSSMTKSVDSNGWRKANRKIQGKTLRAADTFTIQEKRYWPGPGQSILGGVSETKLARTTWPKTHWPRRIMRPCDKATADSCSVQSFAIVKTNSSLLRTVCFVPEERQPLHFL